MRTASVRDLRNRFADVARWIEHGEQIRITRNGKPFATLSAARPEKPAQADWAGRMKRFMPVGQGLTKIETDKVWSDLRD